MKSEGQGSWPRPLPPTPRGFHVFISLEIRLPLAYFQFPKSHSIAVQEECEKWPFRSFIYSLKAEEWPGKEVLGAWTPGANEALCARVFNSGTNVQTLRAIMQQVTCVGVFLSSARSQTSTFPVERDTQCAASVVCRTAASDAGGGVQAHHCPQHRAPLAMLPLQIQEHWTASQKAHASFPGVYFKHSESPWQNKHHLFRCGNCQISS